MNRRRFLKACVPAIGSGVAGCLRLAENSESRPATGSQSNSTSTGVGPSTANQTPPVDQLFNVEWRKDARIFTIAVHNDSLFGDSAGEIQKMAAATGDIQWRNTPEHARDDNLIETIKPTESVVCAIERSDPDSNEPVRIIALDPQSGDELWYFDGEFTDWFISPNPCDVSDQYVAFTQQAQSGPQTNIWTVDVNTGAELSKTTVGQGDDVRYIRSVIIRDERLFLFGNKVEIRDIKTGSIIESADLDLSHALLGGESVYAGGQGVVAKLEMPELTVSWRTDISNSITATPAITSDGSRVLMGGKSGIYCFDTSTGQEEWKYRTAGAIEDGDGGIKTTKGLAWTIDTSGYLSIIDINTGGVLYDEQQKSQRDRPSNMALSESMLYLARNTQDETPQTGLPKGISALSVTNDY